MPNRLAIAMFVDACGWDVVGHRPEFLHELSHRQRVESLFGYSSACVPAILTGRLPNANDHWSSFFYSPRSSPFKAVRWLRPLPKFLFDRGRVRRYLSIALAKAHGFTGYFQIYNLPFDVLPLFDYAEKNDIFVPGGINRGTSIFDYLEQNHVTNHVSNWRRSEEANIAALERALRTGRPRFAFLYTAQLDALMHEHTKDSPRVDAKLAWYQKQILRLLGVAKRRYDEVRLAIFSDHGMATVHTVVDWMPRIESAGLTFGRDYAAVYDSTMMRFWFLRPRAEDRIRSVLTDGKQARWVSDDALRAYGTYWPDGKFGEGIYAFEPGVILNPSHMGRVAPAGMHGYRPDHPDSDACLLSNFEPARPVVTIPDLYELMREMSDWACTSA